MTKADLPVWLQELRQKNLTEFEQIGFPTTQNETWKYTNVKFLTKKSFTPAKPNLSKDLTKFTQGLTGTILLFVNGYLHSSTHTDQTGLTIQTLAEAIEQQHPALSKLNQLAKEINHGFAKSNSAFLFNGAFVHLAKNAVIAEPIHLVYLNNEQNSAQYMRNLVIAEEHSKVLIMEHYLSAEPHEYLTNTISEIFVGANAHVQHIKLQNESLSAYHIGTTKVAQQADSHFTSDVISLGAKLSRSDTEIALIGSNCYAAQHGLYLGAERQHMDHHTIVDHQNPNCNSTQLYKGILDQAARAVFNGKVRVAPHASKTDSSQMIKNLLLSNGAEADAKPELEIYNDDVKCSHGATVGQLDDEQLFYLLSRGLDHETAKSLLMFAFSYEIVKQISDTSLRTLLRQQILQKLPAGKTVQELLS